jgi:hypothetical protein
MSKDKYGVRLVGIVRAPVPPLDTGPLKFEKPSSNLTMPPKKKQVWDAAVCSLSH